MILLKIADFKHIGAGIYIFYECVYSERKLWVHKHIVMFPHSQAMYMINSMITEKARHSVYQMYVYALYRYTLPLFGNATSF